METTVHTGGLLGKYNILEVSRILVTSFGVNDR